MSHRPAVLTAAFLAILVIGLWPYLAYLHAVPLQPDSIKWIVNADPDSANWSHWTFYSSHFVGYRPLTALSFTADLKAFGSSALALRCTDLGLHVLSSLAVGLLALRLAGPLAAIVALLWFAGHPGTDEIVPFLARRSYSLTVLCAVVGFLSSVTAVRSGRPLMAWAAGLLVGPLMLAALFANELGAVVGLLLPVIAFASGSTGAWRRSIAVAAWGWAWIAAGIWLRYQVLRGDSGYLVLVEEAGRSAEILRLYTAALGGEFGSLSSLQKAAGLAAGLYYVVMAVSQGDRQERILTVGLLGVLVAYGATVVHESVWFPRQVYPATALVALLVATVTVRALAHRPESAGRLSRGVHLVPLTAVFFLSFNHSPIMHGTGEARLNRAKIATRYCSSLQDDLKGLKGPAEVFVVAPVHDHEELAMRSQRTSMKARERRPLTKFAALGVPFRWVRFAARQQDTILTELLYVTDLADEHPPTLSDQNPAVLRLPPTVSCFAVIHRQIRKIPIGQQFLAMPPSSRATPYLWMYGPDGGLLPMAN